MSDAPATGDVLEIFSDERKRSFLNVDGAGRPLKSPVAPDTIHRARAYRLQRIRSELVRQGCAAALLYNPINIRYAFDYTNMQIWTMHEMLRYALVFADGPAIMFEFKGCEHLAKLGYGIDEIRPSIGYLYMTHGTNAEAQAKTFAAEIAGLMRKHGKGGRLAIDRIEPHGLHALEAEGIVTADGQKVMEHARVIKAPEEIDMMRWTIRVAESGLARMYEMSEPGVTENEVWAELHHENIRSGGEWFECRLLSSGPRTNPWYQEASDRVIAAGDMISFDTDMIGPYGVCADISRSWTCGHTRMSNRQWSLYAKAQDQIEHNLALLKPGLSFREFNEKSWRIPEKHQPFTYSLALHGVGLADEWPVVALHTTFGEPYGQTEGMFEAGMTVCVESLMAEQGSESIKLETQVLITETGAERLDHFPWETQ